MKLTHIHWRRQFLCLGAACLLAACSSAPKLDDLAQRQLAQALEYQELGEDVRVEGSIFNPLEVSLPTFKNEIIADATDVTITRGAPRFKLVSSTRFGDHGLETVKTAFGFLPIKIAWTATGQPPQIFYTLLTLRRDDVPLDAEEAPNAIEEQMTAEFFNLLGQDIHQLNTLKESKQKVKILLPLGRDLELHPVTR